MILKASHTGDYDDGIRIEGGPWANGRNEWACYAWDEWGLPDIAGVFLSRKDALDVLAANRDYLEYRGYQVSLA